MHVGNLLHRAEKSSQPGSHHHQKAFGLVEGTESSLRAEENGQLCLVSLRQPPHATALRTPRVTASARFGERESCLMPPRFSPLVWQQRVGKHTWQRCQAGDAGVCSLRHACPGGQRAEPAARFCGSLLLLELSLHSMREQKRENAPLATGVPTASLKTARQAQGRRTRNLGFCRCCSFGTASAKS